MRIPTLTGIVDLIALQNAITLILLSNDRLKDIPIIPELRLYLESDLQVDALWTLPRSALIVQPYAINSSAATGGPVGAGILVEMVEATTGSPGVDGPPLTWLINVVTFEDRNTNLTLEVGTGIMCEQIAQLVVDALHKQAVFGYGTLQATTRPITPAEDWMTLRPGILAYRSSLQATTYRPQTRRSTIAPATFDSGQCTLTCTDPDAHIIYTIDGTMPVKANTNALPYEGPFAVPSGTVILTATWKEDLILSEILGFVAP